MIEKLACFTHKQDTLIIGIMQEVDCDEIVKVVFNDKEYSINNDLSKDVDLDLKKPAFCKIFRVDYCFDTMIIVYSSKNCDNFKVIRKDFRNKHYLMDCFEFTFPFILGHANEKWLSIAKESSNVEQTVFLVGNEDLNNNEFSQSKFTKTSHSEIYFEWLFFKKIEEVVKKATVFFKCYPFA